MSQMAPMPMMPPAQPVQNFFMGGAAMSGGGFSDADIGSQIDSFDTYDWTWKQKIMDSGASMADIRNKNLAVEKKELEHISARNDLIIEAADA